MRFSIRILLPVWLMFLFSACTQQIDNTGTTSNSGSTGPASATSDPKNPAYTPPTNKGDSTGGGSTSTGTASSNNSNKDSLTLSYVVNNNCVDTNIQVNFTAKYSRTIKSATYEWYFNDGNSIPSTSSASVYNTYAYKGTYSVLVKIDSAGSNIASLTKTITLAGSSTMPSVFFTAFPTNSTNTAYAFNGSKTTIPSGTISNYIWDFGDTYGDKSNNSYVTHSYAQQPTAQTYYVTLTAVGSSGCSSYQSKQIIIPAGSSLPTGGFTYKSTSPCAPSSESFTFTSNATNLPPNPVYTWSFGDGSGGTGPSVTKSFNQGGSYPVTLTITGNNSNSIVSQSSQNINAYGQNVTPTAGFTIAPASSGYAITFINTSSVPNGTLTYSWNFGDFTSTTTTQNTVSKTYTSAATNTVTLTATSNAGCSSVASQNITVPLR